MLAGAGAGVGAGELFGVTGRRRCRSATGPCAALGGAGLPLKHP